MGTCCPCLDLPGRGCPLPGESWDPGFYLCFNTLSLVDGGSRFPEADPIACSCCYEVENPFVLVQEHSFLSALPWPSPGFFKKQATAVATERPCTLGNRGWDAGGNCHGLVLPCWVRADDGVPICGESCRLNQCSEPAGSPSGSHISYMQKEKKSCDRADTFIF